MESEELSKNFIKKLNEIKQLYSEEDKAILLNHYYKEYKNNLKMLKMKYMNTNQNIETTNIINTPSLLNLINTPSLSNLINIQNQQNLINTQNSSNLINTQTPSNLINTKTFNSYSSVYSKKSNPDGTFTVHEKNVINDNGKIKKNENSYIIK